MSYDSRRFEYKLYIYERRQPDSHEHEVWYLISPILLQAGQTDRIAVQLSLRSHKISVQNHKRIPKKL